MMESGYYPKQNKRQAATNNDPDYADMYQASHHQKQNPHQHPQQNHPPTLDHTGLEIIRQGYGISQGIKADILEFFRTSLKQTEYKNPADFIKHRLDSKHGPFWFVFMWEDKKHNSAQYSYYNNDDRVLEFKYLDWKVLIYSFNQTTYTHDVMIPHGVEQDRPPSIGVQERQKLLPPRQPYPQYYPAEQPYPEYYHLTFQNNSYREFYEEENPYYIPQYPYPSLMRKPRFVRPRWYYY